LTTRSVGRPKLPKPVFGRQPCFSSKQVAKILAAAEPHDACVFATLAYTGMRIGELCALRWDDIDLKLGTCHGDSGGTSGGGWVD
jgi:integrase